jgi:hypothetical protein
MESKRLEQAVLLEYSAGAVMRDIAAKYGVTERSCWRALNRARVATPEVINPEADWRPRLIRKSLAAIEAALDSTDPDLVIDRARLGARLLQGVGLLETKPRGTVNNTQVNLFGRQFSDMSDEQLRAELDTLRSRRLPVGVGDGTGGSRVQ